MAGQDRLQDKVAVITGGAFGIGRATAQRLASEGASVAILDVELEEAGRVASSLPRAIALPGDVTKEEQLVAAIDQVIDTFGGVDILVNNAGGGRFPPKPFWEMTRSEWDYVFECNVTSGWLCTKAVLPSMRDRKGGKIVNISSSGGIGGSVGFCAYSAAKGGVIVMTKSMARELAEFCINVNAIAPGYTRFTRPKPVATAEQVVALEQRALEGQVLRRIGQPEDIAAAVAYLASADADQVTGHVILVDGGGQR